MTTLKTLITSQVAQELATAAADDGLTVNDLRSPQVRKRLGAGFSRPPSPEQWGDAERGLRWLTKHRSGATDTCSACSELVMWVESARNSRAMPLDPLPTPTGNLRLERRGQGRLAHVIPKADTSEGLRYQAHFVSCPHAGQMRSRRRPKAAGPVDPRFIHGGRLPVSDKRCTACGERLAQSLVDDGETVHILCGPPPPPERHLRLVEGGA